MTTFNTRITTQEQAQELIASLLLRFSGATALDRLNERATESKQSVTEVSRRTASNLLNNGVTHKPGGFIDFFA